MSNQVFISPESIQAYKARSVKTKINVKCMVGANYIVDVLSDAPEKITEYFNRLNVKRRLLRKPKTHFSK